MLKVGDIVTIKSKGSWKNSDAKYIAGQTSKILKVDSDGVYDYRIDLGASNTYWVAHEDILASSAVSSVIAKTTLPTAAEDRKNIPIISGVLDYFTSALAEVAKVSKAGNDQHNPGQPLHWARRKSSDHADCIGRHLSERGTVDTDGQRHSAKLAWRALALLQEELEAEGAPISRGSSYDEEKK